jgi:divalent metal cation (Fe/Co/Zn/Cd) transporter
MVSTGPSRGIHGITMMERRKLLARGLRLEVFTVVWNVLEGVVAVAAGTVSGSVALIGFGVDSFVETASAVVVGWRLRSELRGGSADAAARYERLATRIAGFLLLVLSVYILIDAGRRLLGFGGEARESLVGIVLTSASLVVMPILGRAKLRMARSLNSRALRADAYETIACAWLSLTTLAGLALNALFGWWWADPVAAMCLVPLIVREGLEGLRGDECACGESE